MKEITIKIQVEDKSYENLELLADKNTVEDYLKDVLDEAIRNEFYILSLAIDYAKRHKIRLTK